MKTLCNYISKYMAVLVLVASGAALMFPGVLEHVPTTVINPLLGVIMFGMGLTLNLKDFKIVFSLPKDVRPGKTCRMMMSRYCAREGDCGLLVLFF